MSLKTPLSWVDVEIIFYISQSSTKSKNEPEIRKFLEENHRITAIKTSKHHLERLNFFGILEKTLHRGRSNVWTLKEDKIPVFNCPLCGGRPKVGRGGSGWLVECADTYHCSSVTAETKADAIIAWDRREHP